MAFTHIKAVRAQSKATGNARLVLLVLATYADEFGHCYTLRSDLANDCAIDERSLIRHLNTLEKLNEITISRGNGRGNRTDYVVNLGNEKRVTNQAERVTDLPPFNDEKRVTNQAERVTGNAERVTKSALKGDKTYRAYKEMENQKNHLEKPNGKPSESDAHEPAQTESENLTPSHSPLVSALCQLCRLESEMLSPSKWAEVRAVAQTLERTGRTVEQVTEFQAKWFSLDWRGKDDRPPTLNQVRDEWSKTLSLKPQQEQNKNGNSTGTHQAGTTTNWAETVGRFTRNTRRIGRNAPPAGELPALPSNGLDGAGTGQGSADV